MRSTYEKALCECKAKTDWSFFSFPWGVSRKEDLSDWFGKCCDPGSSYWLWSWKTWVFILSLMLLSVLYLQESCPDSICRYFKWWSCAVFLVMNEQNNSSTAMIMSLASITISSWISYPLLDFQNFSFI